MKICIGTVLFKKEKALEKVLVNWNEGNKHLSFQKLMNVPLKHKKFQSSMQIEIW